MAGREISLYLKYPGSSIALQRLQHSFLECVVEHKSGTFEELQSCPPSYLKSDCQLKGSATLEDDELVIAFIPKHPGLHTARLFADTRELCKPVAFVVSQTGDIESTPIDKPVRQNSSLFRQITPSPAPSSQQLRMSQAYGTMQSRNMTANFGQMLLGPPGMRDSMASHQFHQQQEQQQEQMQQQMQQQSYEAGFPQGFTSDPVLTRQAPGPEGGTQLASSGGGRAMSTIYQQRTSHMIPGVSGSRPVSMMPIREDQAFAGDLHSMAAEKSSFNQLHSRKVAGEQAKIRKDFLMVDHSKVVTPNTFDSLEKDVSQLVGSKGMKTRRRCTVCSKKVKMTKLVYLGDHDFCETCFRRQYGLRSAVDHFHIPTIQESAVDVPINKKGTKFITTRKTIPDLNLRGLEAAEVRYAQEEFKKFEMDSSGWINKAVLFPLLKACFFSHLKDHEIKLLLSSQAFKSLITSYGIDERDEVHELEFLSLLAFLAREAISLKGIGVGFSKAKKFSPGDLQMAYAFHNKFGKGSTTQQPWSDPGNMGTQQQQISPSHISPSHRPPPAQHYQLNTSPQHAPGGLGQQGHQQDRLSSSGQGYAGQFPSPTTVARDYQGFSESYGGHMMQQQQPAEMAGQRLNQSARYSGQGMQFGAAGRQTLQDEQRMSMLGQGDRQSRPVSYLPQGLVEQERKTMSSTMQLYPGPMGSGGGQDMQFSPLGPMLDAGRSSAFSAPPGGSPPMAPGLQELPEEDQDEPPEMPKLPPNKDPLRHTISLQKKQTNSKKIMQELKLTGDSADSWMMY